MGGKLTRECQLIQNGKRQSTAQGYTTNAVKDFLFKGYMSCSLVHACSLKSFHSLYVTMLNFCYLGSTTTLRDCHRRLSTCLALCKDELFYFNPTASDLYFKVQCSEAVMLYQWNKIFYSALPSRDKGWRIATSLANKTNVLGVVTPAIAPIFNNHFIKAHQ